MARKKKEEPLPIIPVTKFESKIHRNNAKCKNQELRISTIAIWIKRYVTTDFTYRVVDNLYIFETSDIISATTVDRLLSEVEEQGYPSRNNYL